MFPEKRNNDQEGRRAQVVEEEKFDCRELEPKEGTCLMMRKAFLQIPHTQELPQRNNLFRKRIKCQGKVYNLLIDLGSTENLVSFEMVEKLKLPKKPHPFPYHISWLKKGQQTLVIEQAWI